VVLPRSGPFWQEQGNSPLVGEVPQVRIDAFPSPESHLDGIQFALLSGCAKIDMHCFDASLRRINIIIHKFLEENR